MIIPHYYEDPHSLHVGTMPNRAYYIPASRRSDALVEHRETSDRFQLLTASRSPACGRTTVTTTTSTPTSAIPSPLIRRMFPKRTMIRRWPCSRIPASIC